MMTGCPSCPRSRGASGHRARRAAPHDRRRRRRRHLRVPAARTRRDRATHCVGRQLTAAHRRGKTMWCRRSATGRCSACTWGWPAASSSPTPTDAPSRAATPYAAAATQAQARVVPVHDPLRGRRHAAAVRQAPPRPRAARPRPRRARPRRRRDPPWPTSGTSAGPRHRAGQGAPARPVRDRRRRQPARRPDPLAGRSRPTAPRRHPRRRGARPPCTARCARATRPPSSHGGVHTGEVIEHRRRGGHCPRCGAAMTRAHRRRAHDVVVPGGAAVSRPAGLASVRGGVA